MVVSLTQVNFKTNKIEAQQMNNNKYRLSVHLIFDIIYKHIKDPTWINPKKIYIKDA